MKLINLKGRLALVRDGGALDVETASNGQFGPDPQSVYDQWPEFVIWAQTASGHIAGYDTGDLESPVPRPPQVFAIGLNYTEHAAESGFVKPDHPVVFTKYRSSFTGPVSQVQIPVGGNVDWEVELVVVIGQKAHQVPVEDAWSYVAGVTVGQDISERLSQHRGPAPQFGLAKSFPGFSPMGPAVVTPDELDDPDDLELGCSIDGEVVQKGRTSQLIFPVPELISRLSQTVTLLPGDVIWTGTPSGVGAGRTPQRFLAPGSHLQSYIAGVGQLDQTFAAVQAS